MDDAMEVDGALSAAQQLATEPAAEPAAEPADASTLLRHALQPFIRANLSRALGEDMLPLFQPPANATLPSLLRFLLSKWLGVFSDSSLAAHRAEVEALFALAARPRGGQAEQRKEAALAEGLLLALGQPSLAARAAALEPGAARGATTAPLRLVSGTRAAQAGDGAVKRIPVVLDGSNIAWRHGRERRFSIRGPAEALHHFSSRGHPTVLFLPEARLKRCAGGAEDAPFFEAIKALVGGESLVATPEKDYDDSYICHFARRHCAVIVSNDEFRDQVYQASADGERQAEAWAKWLEACRVSFTFHGHEFIPNPAFNYDKAAVVAKQLMLND